MSRDHARVEVPGRVDRVQCRPRGTELKRYRYLLCGDGAEGRRRSTLAAVVGSAVVVLGIVGATAWFGIGIPGLRPTVSEFPSQWQARRAVVALRL